MGFMTGDNWEGCEVIRFWEIGLAELECRTCWTKHGDWVC